MIQDSDCIAFRIMAIYAVISVVWILVSDYFVTYFISNPTLAMNIGIVKGWLFVAITAGLLYKITLKHTKSLIKSEKKLKKKNMDIMETYEELLATDEELKQQFEELVKREGKIIRRNERLAVLHKDLQVSQRRNQALIDAIPDSIFQLDQYGTLLDYKEGRECESIIDVQDQIGKKIDKFVSPAILGIFLEKIRQALLTGTIQFFEYKNTQQSIVKYQRYQEVRIVPSGSNEVIAIVRDVTARKAMEEKLNYIALHDKITGLYNRVYFEEKMQQLTDSQQVPIGIIMCDIDGLKLVNDTFGHQVGDKLIISVAAIIAECLTEMDEVARVGGDEFVIILPNKDSLQVKAIYHRIHERVSQFSQDNIELNMGISIGLSVRKNLGQSMYEVFKIADDNMYREKARNCQKARKLKIQNNSNINFL